MNSEIQEAPVPVPLIRPPVVLSAAASAFAGSLAGGAALLAPGPWLVMLIAAALYAAGECLRRYFDLADAARLRPDDPFRPGLQLDPRPWRAGLGLLLAGLGLAALGVITRLGDRDTAAAAIAVALAVVLYASWTRGVWGAGFVTWGAGRALTFILGLTVSPFGGQLLTAALPVLLYATGWSVFRHLRQPGAPPSTGFVALLHLVAALSVLLYQSTTAFSYRIDALPFLLACIMLAYPRYVNALQDVRRAVAERGVQFGLIALTLLEASLAGGHAGVVSGAFVALFCVPLYWSLLRWPVPLITTPR